MKEKLLQFLLICNSFVVSTVPPLKAGEVFYELTNGDKISGKLIKEESTEKRKAIMHPILGRLEVNVDSIKVEKLSNKQKLWTSNILIGLDSKHTNHYKNSGFSIESEIEYEGEKNLSTFEIEFNYGIENDKVTNEKLGSYDTSLNARNDYLLTDKFTIYTSSDYYFDSQSHDGKNDINGSMGLGYYLFKNKSSDLLISLGPALIWKEGGDDCSITTNCGDLIYATNLEVTFGWLINKHLEFDLNNTYTNANSEGNRTISSNRLDFKLKFFPDLNSNLFSAISYENIYHDLSNSLSENEYKLELGTNF